MSGVNKVIILGNLGNDPETSSMPNGNAVAKVSIATSEKWKKDGQDHERTEWHRVVFFGKLAEIVGQCTTFDARGHDIVMGPGLECMNGFGEYDLMRGEEHGLFEGSEKVLVWLGVLDRLELVLGVGPDQELCFAARANAHGHADLVGAAAGGLTELGAANNAQDRIGLVQNEAQILQCRHHGAERLLPVRGVESAGLKAAELNLALGDRQNLLLRIGLARLGAGQDQHR